MKNEKRENINQQPRLKNTDALEPIAAHHDIVKFVLNCVRMST